MITLGTLLLLGALAVFAVGWASRSPAPPPVGAMAPAVPATSEIDETKTVQTNKDGIVYVQARVLAFPEVVTQHYLSQSVIAVELDDVVETLRDIPRDEDGDFIHAMRGFLCGVGDLVREPEHFGFKQGQPVRYWALLPSEAKTSPAMTRMALFELVQPPPSA